MATFKDNAGHEWRVKLTVGTLGDLKRDAGIDLSAAMREPKGLADLLFTDPSTLVAGLWVLCRDQAEKAGVSADEYPRRFDGETLETATEALLDETAGFFPRSQVAKAIRANLRTTLERIDRAAISSLTALNSPGGSASIPTPGPSAS